MDNKNKLLERKDIDKEYKWDVESLYENLDAWEEDYKLVEKKVEEFLGYKSRLKEGPETLLEALRARDNIFRILGNLYSYASLKLDEDTRDSKYQALSDKAFRLYIASQEKMAFFTPEVLEFTKEEIEDFFKRNKDLCLYRQEIKETLRRKDHILSPREEAIMSKASEMASNSENVFSMLNNADLKFPSIKNEEGEEVEITHGNYISLMMSKDRAVRKNAFEQMYSVYMGLKNTFAAVLDGELKANKFFAEMRGYKNTMEASLDENNISVDVYNNLIATIHENMEPMYKYVKIRKRAMDLDEIHMYDIYNPIVKDYDFKYSFEEAKELIEKALEPLGEEYLEIVREGFNSRWIDVYENVGKRSGGYSGGSYDSKPFILLNYKDTIDSVFTTAHEMGHSIHSYLSRKNQPFIYSSYGIFVAEVASTVNEVLLINYLLENAKTKSEKAYLLGHFIDAFRATVYRQTMFAEFEKIINEYVEAGGALTADYLNDEYKKLNRLYFGEEMVLDDEIDHEWSRIPHFYYNYYVYQYATGYSAAVSIASKILAKEEGIVDRYIKFLSSGSSDYPLNILKDLGVNMEEKTPVENAIKVFSDLVDELDKLI